MVTRKTVRAAQTQEQESSIDPSQVIVAETENSESIESLLQDLEGFDDANNKVKIYKKVKGEKEKYFLDEMTPGAFSMLALQESQGAGTYEIVVYGSNGIITRKLVNIGAPIRKPQLTADDIATTVQKAIADLQPAQREQPAEKQKSGREIMQEYLGIAAAMLPIVKTVIDVLKPAPAPAPKTLAEQVTELQALQQFFEQNQKSDSGESSILKDLAPVFAGMFAAGKQQQNEPNPQIEQQPATDGKTPMANVIDQAINTIISAAQNNADPAQFIPLIMSLGNPDLILEVLESDDWFQQLCAMVPQAAANQIWFERLREAVFLEYPAIDEPGGMTIAQDQKNAGIQQNDAIREIRSTKKKPAR